MEQLAGIESKLPERVIPLLSHSINAHQIWNARITNKEKLKVHQVHDLQECKRIDDDNYNSTIEILKDRELDEIITYQNSKGVDFNNSIREILFHISNHFSHHRGQIISDIRQIGIDPIVTDYIFYKR